MSGERRVLAVVALGDVSASGQLTDLEARAAVKALHAEGWRMGDRGRGLVELARKLATASDSFRQEPPPLAAGAAGPGTGGGVASPVVLLNLDETARRLRCSRRTVERLVGEGKLPSRKISRRRFVHVDDLDAYLERCAEGAA